MENISGQETHNASSTILPLPDDVVAQIKSSTTITSLNQVVLGLFENSLDAQSTKIDISVDYRRHFTIRISRNWRTRSHVSHLQAK
jgi:DNA mismatch repair protein MLH3